MKTTGREFPNSEMTENPDGDVVGVWTCCVTQIDELPTQFSRFSQPHRLNIQKSGSSNQFDSIFVILFCIYQI